MLAGAGMLLATGMPGARMPGAGMPDRVPVDLTAQEARRLAELELADPAYRAAQPGLLQKVIDWLVEQVQHALAVVSDTSPGGWVGILGLVTVLVIAVLFVRWRLGPVTRSAVVTFTVDPGTSAAQYRARAAELAAAGSWGSAVSERMRALVRAAQERGLVDSQPGWTADEVAAAVAEQLPGSRELLTAAARAFDDVRYGGRPADRGAYETVESADDQVARAHPAPTTGVDR
jgi:hypothetical protein